MSFLFGFASFVTPIITLLVAYKFKSKPFVEEINYGEERESIDSKILDKGYKFRTFWHHLCVDQNYTIFWLPAFYSRKLLYGIVLVYLHDSILA